MNGPVLIAVNLFFVSASLHAQHLLQAPRPPERKAVCGLVPFAGRSPFRKGTLSPFWAYEVIGADLADESLVDDKDLSDVPVAIMEGGFARKSLKVPRTTAMAKEEREGRYDDTRYNDANEHSTLVAHVLFREGLRGTSTRARLAAIASYGESHYATAIDAAGRLAEARPKIINFSASSGDSDLTYRAFAPLAEKAIFVHAAGNEYPHTPGIDANQKRLDVVTVGSMEAHGFVSHFSIPDRKVDILAPGQDVLSLGNKEENKFGATSAATALVTGGLTYVLSILGNLDASQARMLLRRTAVPVTSSDEKPRRHGAGLLNIPKFIEVAKRLSKKGWRGIQKKERDTLLTDEKLYEFDMTEKFYKAQKLLAKKDCESKMAGFKNLRLAFHLHPTAEYGAALARIYREEGLTTNAEFYENLDATKRVANLVKMAGGEQHLDDPATSLLAALLMDREKRGVLPSVLKQLKKTDDETLKQLMDVETAKKPPPDRLDHYRKQTVAEWVTELNKGDHQTARDVLDVALAAGVSTKDRVTVLKAALGFSNKYVVRMTIALALTIDDESLLKSLDAPMTKHIDLYLAKEAPEKWLQTRLRKIRAEFE